MGMFHRLPQTMAALERAAGELPHRRRLTTTTATARRARSASSAASSRGTGRTSCPTCSRASTDVADKLGAGATVADVGCGAGGAVLLMAGAFPAAGSPATTSPSTPSTGRATRLAESGPDQRHVPRPPPAAAADRPLRRPRHDVRLHPRHDRPAGDDASDPRRRRRRRHVAARRHQGARHVRRERRARTRWRR